MRRVVNMSMQSCRRRGLCSSSSSSSSVAGAAAAGEEERMLEIWAWGKGDAGQLGTGQTAHLQTPQMVACMEVPSNLHLAPMQGLLQETPLSSLFCKLGNHSAAQAMHANVSLSSTSVSASSSSASCAPATSTMATTTSTTASTTETCNSQVLTLGLACGLFHSALLVEGEMWTWGKGEAGRLGLGSEFPMYSLTSNPHIESIRSMALGGLHSAAITQDGTLYTWGFGAFGALGHGRYKAELLPRKLILGKDEKVAYISAGGSHTAAITSSGDLYTWGRDEGEGRLGHGSSLVTDEGAVNIPLKVKSISQPLNAVSCGGFCTLAVTSTGQVWNWGANSNHELGRGDTQNRSQPSPIPALESMCVVQVACGGYHSAALTDDGKVLTWGCGGNGQLGHGTFKNGKLPQVVEALTDVRVVYITCGSFSTAAITDTGALYCWGKNRDCQLGFPGKIIAENLPIQIVPDLSFIAVALGAAHGIGLVLN